MHDETLETIKRSASIPSIPMVASRCYELTQNPNCDYDKLEQVLSTDPGIASSVLRLANSPLFGVTRQVGSLKHGIALLGVKRIREIVLSRYLVQKTGEVECVGLDFDYFWRLSLTTAILSSKFADALAPQQRDTAFIGGLLADVGVIILARALPNRYQPILDKYHPNEMGEWYSEEQVIMKVSHGDVSALVLEQWSLPDNLVDAVKYHHTPPADIPQDSPGALLARIINGAGGIARMLSQKSNDGALVERCRLAMDRVELDLSVLITAIEGIETEVTQMADLLQVEILNSRIFDLICQQLVTHLQMTEAGAA